MNVLMVASECAPFVKTGGLADVVGALPGALAPLGVDARVVLPAYPALFPLLPKGTEVAQFDDLPGGSGRIVQVEAEGITLLLLDAPQLFDRPGGLYVDENGRDWSDNHLRFGALSMAGARIAMGAIDGYQPDVIHAHDWQAALAPVYLRMAGRDTPRSIITIHNIAFQGRFGPQVLGQLHLKTDWFHPEGLEYHGDLSFLKGALMYSDRITTVSPTYAREILTPEFGMGLDGVLRSRAGALSGLLNGIDIGAWNPADDAALAQPYDVKTLKRKAANRAALSDRLGLDSGSSGPLFCVVSRLTSQKGLDALLEAVPHLVERGAQLAVLGTGQPELEQGFRDAAMAHPGQVATHIGYDEALSHLFQAGSDAIVIPSRFEPCGLTQLYGLRYGTLPVVARTGGLADTVIDANVAAILAKAATGFVFHDVSATGLAAVIDRVVEAYADTKLWQSMQRAAMRHPVSWDSSAQAYRDLYADLL
ncbi:glycogen synthase GlgA [Marivita geojedonensis]|uniref:Glycogen synthase n=1 Tax=Marivita geojedonensis TaxID=1123756 RepID=A0A1X4NQ14_9RHOB|nr:glycogen synthase GlgA [Marivita geojedonensis]OSQ53065.1 glycogen synthase [Marivita geojedonensis]PRY82019.1 starch synthase [Marivita geojedonensis]